MIILILENKEKNAWTLRSTEDLLPGGSKIVQIRDPGYCLLPSNGNPVVTELARVAWLRMRDGLLLPDHWWTGPEFTPTDRHGEPESVNDYHTRISEEVMRGALDPCARKHLCFDEKLQVWRWLHDLEGLSDDLQCKLERLGRAVI